MLFGFIFLASGAFTDDEQIQEATFYCFNEKLFDASWLHQDSFYGHRAAVKSGRRAGAVCLSSLALCFSVHPDEMDQFTCVTVFFFFFFNS